MITCKYMDGNECRKYRMLCRVCCPTCHEPNYETDPAKWRSVL